MILADAAGHGASAAVEVAMLDAIPRTYPGPSQGSAAVLHYANRHLFTRRLRGTFITAFAASFDPRSGTLTYAVAGHNPPLLWRSAGAIEPLAGQAGPPLLVEREQVWQESRTPLSAGDILVLYTDGIPEAVNARGAHFGLQRLRRAVTGARRAPASVVSAVEMAVDDFRDGTPPRDDQTLVVLQVIEPPRDGVPESSHREPSPGAT